MSEPAAPTLPEGARPRVSITYCTQCRWLLRATWLAGELLTSFTTELGEVALVPGVGGVFTVAIDDDVVWDRKRDGGFPDLAPLKRLVRDRVAPGRRPRPHRPARRHGEPAAPTGPPAADAGRSPGRRRGSTRGRACRPTVGARR